MDTQKERSERQHGDLVEALRNVFRTIYGRRILFYCILILLLLGFGQLGYTKLVAAFYQQESQRPVCTDFDKIKSRGIIFTNPLIAKSKPSLFCACLSEASRRTSSNWMNVAIFSGLIGAIFALLGGALGPVEGAKPGSLRAERGILFMGLGALIISFAVYANSRATAASLASAKAHNALIINDKNKMYEACIKAKSLWIASRVESADLLLNRLDPPQTQGTKNDDVKHKGEVQPTEAADQNVERDLAP